MPKKTTLNELKKRNPHGLLRIVSEGDPDNYGNRRFWCACKCGNTVLVQMGHLRTGSVKSCGCWRRKVCGRTGERNFKHGMTNAVVYKAWDNMLSRCRAVIGPYKDISVCKEWETFEQFYADMGEPAPGRSLDRLDCLGDYSKENCRWATPKQQAANKTRLASIFKDVAVRHIPPLKKKFTSLGKVKFLKDNGIVVTPAPQGVCGCGRPTYDDDRFCGRKVCNNAKTKKLGRPLERITVMTVGPVESESTVLTDPWK